jgi:prepilin-type N-terminal cleavage/methylation domain-containing protein
MTTNKGFTLIELLVVIAIVAVLAAAVVLTLNPAELLRQTRDATRLADFSTIKSAMALYLVDVPAGSYSIGNGANCYVEFTAAGPMTAGCDPDGAGALTARFAAGTVTVSAAPIQDIDATGWIPVNFTLISSGSPISALPSDPAQSMASDLFYAYRPAAAAGVCTTGTTCIVYEINANMESAKYAAEEGIDGGNDANRFEAGTDPGLDI